MDIWERGKLDGIIVAEKCKGQSEAKDAPGQQGSRPQGQDWALSSDPDIWRTAHQMIAAHGSEAELEAALLADRFLTWGDPEGQRLWLRIRRAIVELRAVPEGKPL